MSADKSKHYGHDHVPARPRYRLVLTCGACPEQYDVFDEAGKTVGYMRLRHGNFTVQYPDVRGETVYTARPHGDGVFIANERQHHLTQGVVALHRKITTPEITDDDNLDDDETQVEEQWITVP